MKIEVTDGLMSVSGITKEQSEIIIESLTRFANGAMKKYLNSTPEELEILKKDRSAAMQIAINMEAHTNRMKHHYHQLAS